MRLQIGYLIAKQGFKCKLRLQKLKFQKILKRILDVDNDAFYQRAQSQLKIIYILSNTKIKKSDRFGRVEILHCLLHSNVRFIILLEFKCKLRIQLQKSTKFKTETIVMKYIKPFNADHQNQTCSKTFDSALKSILLNVKWYSSTR